MLPRARGRGRAAWPPSGRRPRWRRPAGRLAAFDREALVAAAGGGGAGGGRSCRPCGSALGPWRRRAALASDSRACCAMRCTRVLGQLQIRQVLLATVGSTAPFVGLLGTVWGIYHALTAIGRCGSDHHRPPGWPRGRGPDHDRRRPGGGHSGGAGLQRVWPPASAASRPTWRALRVTCASCWRARPGPAEGKAVLRGPRAPAHGFGRAGTHHGRRSP